MGEAGGRRRWTKNRICNDSHCAGKAGAEGEAGGRIRWVRPVGKAGGRGWDPGRQD